MLNLIFLEVSPEVKKWYILNDKIVLGLSLLCCFNLKIQEYTHDDL
jgi:hypothetical protein